jgi:hypothetical protein
MIHGGTLSCKLNSGALLSHFTPPISTNSLALQFQNKEILGLGYNKMIEHLINVQETLGSTILHIYTNIYKHKHTYIYTYIHIYMYIDVHICIYTCIYILQVVYGRIFNIHEIISSKKNVAY